MPEEVTICDALKKENPNLPNRPVIENIGVDHIVDSSALLAFTR